MLAQPQGDHKKNNQQTNIVTTTTTSLQSPPAYRPRAVPRGGSGIRKPVASSTTNSRANDRLIGHVSAKSSAAKAAGDSTSVDKHEMGDRLSVQQQQQQQQVPTFISVNYTDSGARLDSKLNGCLSPGSYRRHYGQVNSTETDYNNDDNVNSNAAVSTMASNGRFISSGSRQSCEHPTNSGSAVPRQTPRLPRGLSKIPHLVMNVMNENHHHEAVFAMKRDRQHEQEQTPTKYRLDNHYPSSDSREFAVDNLVNGDERAKYLTFNKDQATSHFKYLKEELSGHIDPVHRSLDQQQPYQYYQQQQQQHQHGFNSSIRQHESNYPSLAEQSSTKESINGCSGREPKPTERQSLGATTTLKSLPPLMRHSDEQNNVFASARQQPICEAFIMTGQSMMKLSCDESENNNNSKANKITTNSDHNQANNKSQISHGSLNNNNYNAAGGTCNSSEANCQAQVNRQQLQSEPTARMKSMSLDKLNGDNKITSDSLNIGEDAGAESTVKQVIETTLGSNNRTNQSNNQSGSVKENFYRQEQQQQQPNELQPSPLHKIVEAGASCQQASSRWTRELSHTPSGVNVHTSTASEPGQAETRATAPLNASATTRDSPTTTKKKASEIGMSSLLSSTPNNSTQMMSSTLDSRASPESLSVAANYTRDHQTDRESNITGNNSNELMLNTSCSNSSERKLIFSRIDPSQTMTACAISNSQKQLSSSDDNNRTSNGDANIESAANQTNGLNAMGQERSSGDGSHDHENAVTSSKTDTDTSEEIPNDGPTESDRESARRLAKRLYNLSGFKRSDVCHHLAKCNPFSQTVAEEYLNLFDFRSMKLDGALRKFLSKLQLTGETQERERMLSKFSQRYYYCNKDKFPSSDAVQTLVCAMILLNTDLHGGQWKSKKSKRNKLGLNAFIDGLNSSLASLPPRADGDHPDNSRHAAPVSNGPIIGYTFPHYLLVDLYESIRKRPLKCGEENCDITLFEAELDKIYNQQVNAGGRANTLPTRRFAPGSNAPSSTLSANSRRRFKYGLNRLNANSQETFEATIEFRSGYLNRKRIFEPHSKPTGKGRRGWRRFNCILRDLRLIMRPSSAKDEIGESNNPNEVGRQLQNVKQSIQSRSQAIASDIKNTVKIHHTFAYASKSYIKREHVFHLRLADQSEFLMQADSEQDMKYWLDTINFASACLSSPALPSAVSNSKSQQQRILRPLLPAAYTRLSYWEQLMDHEERLQRLKVDLDDHLAEAPRTRNATKRDKTEFIDRIAHLKQEIERYTVYVDLMRKKSNSPEAIILSKHPQIASMTPSDEMIKSLPSFAPPPTQEVSEETALENAALTNGSSS